MFKRASGSSWAGVVRALQAEGLTSPADLYLGKGATSTEVRRVEVTVCGCSVADMYMHSGIGMTTAQEGTILFPHLLSNRELVTRGYYVDILESLRPG